MRQERYLNENFIRQAIAVLKPQNQLFEVRVFGSNKKTVLSGYFRDADTLIRSFDSIDVREKNVYITLNELKEELYSRLQHDKFVNGVSTTSDTEVQNYNWLFIDLDPVRATGISSSDEELQAAKKSARKIYLYLKELGFNEPVKALSGNGCHLLYRVNLKNTEARKELIEQCLKALASMFDSDQVKVDTTNYNPARICKLYGTLAQKGASTTERPHRMSRIFSAPEVIEPTDIVYLQKLASNFPEPVPAPPTYKSQVFNLQQFMADNGLTYSKTSSGKESIVYHLDACPFNDNHIDGDAKIFEYNNGAIAFKCHHNSCSQYHWQDVRAKFDPGCYDRTLNTVEDDRIDKGWREHNRNKSAEELLYSKPVIINEAEMFRTAQQIADDVEPEKEFVPTGIMEIDRKLHGLAKTEVSVVSGLRSGGKSTLIGQLILNAVESEHTVICYSGELNNKKYLNWLTLQAAGHNNIQISTKYDNAYYVADDVKQMIYDWMGDKFWLYNNKCGNKFTEIVGTLRNVITQHHADLCVIDNLMILDLSGVQGGDKYEQQKKFVLELKQIAEDTNCHVLFVAHPRKSVGFLRLEDISGSGDIVNIVDNAFIVHRVNHDFEKRTAEEFGWKANNAHYLADNIIEVAKDRENGTQDFFIDLFFDEASKRLKNQKDENIIFSWQPKNDDDFRLATSLDEIPF